MTQWNQNGGPPPGQYQQPQGNYGSGYGPPQPGYNPTPPQQGPYAPPPGHAPPPGYDGQQQGYPPPGQYPQQQQGWPGAPQVAPPQHSGYGPPGPSYPQQGAPQAPQQGRGRVDGTNMWGDDYQGVTAAAIEQAAREQAVADARRAGGTGGKREFKPLGPNGETKWKDIPWQQGRNYVSTTRAWIVGSPSGGMPFTMEASHFWKSASAPNGTGCACSGPGREKCAVCCARSALYKSGNKQDADLADKWKVRKQGLMDLIMVDDYQQHLTADGRMEPVLWRAPPGVIEKLEKILSMSGGGRLLHPVHGRPFVITKTKNGPKEMDIEWDIQPAFNPEPLNIYFQPIFSNLTDFESMKRRISAADMAKAIREMGYPMTPEVVQMLNATAAQWPEPPPLSQGGGGFNDGQQQGGYGGQQSYQQAPGPNPNYDPRQQMADQVRGGGGRW